MQRCIVLLIFWMGQTPDLAMGSSDSPTGMGHVDPSSFPLP